MPSPLPDEALLIRNETGTQKLIGYVVDISQPPHGLCWLDVGQRHLNRHDVLHGGIASCLLDSASGTTGSLAVDATGRAPFLTVSLTTQFVGPGHPGRVTARGTITGGGRNLFYITGELRHADGALIATSTGVFKRVPREKLT